MKLIDLYNILPVGFSFEQLSKPILFNYDGSPIIKIAKDKNQLIIRVFIVTFGYQNFVFPRNSSLFDKIPKSYEVENTKLLQFIFESEYKKA